MDDETARHMDRLLAGGKLSGPEADAILERVLQQVAREEPRPVRRIAYWAGPVLAAAATVMLLIYLPRGPWQDGPVAQLEEGDLSALSVTCSPGTLASCPTSSSLVFSVEDKSASGFLSAYAEPIGGDGELVWYASKEDGSPEMAGTDKGIGKRTVRLSVPPKPGRYRVYAVLADRALTREETSKAASAQGTAHGVRARLRIEVVVTE